MVSLPVRSMMIAGALTLATGTAAVAKEYYVGEPITKNELQLVPHYLTGIKMEPMSRGMTMDAKAIHLELDVKATKGEKHGFAEDSWIPYVSIRYVLEKVGDPKFKKTGQLLAMTAGDGAHYANNVDFGGDGKYKVTFTLTPPSANGFYRHVDTETGVPDWWQPFSVDWTFDFPAKDSAK